MRQAMMAESSSTGQQRASSTIAFMKASRTREEARNRSIEISDSEELLVPVGEVHADDAGLVELLARWRHENALAFPNRFPVTREGTARWLRERILDVSDRLLFLIELPDGRPIGHIGIANALADGQRVEIDSVLRGCPKARPGAMSEALRTVVTWIEKEFSPGEIFLRVLGSNAHAIGFYARHGFVQTSSVPLRRVVEGTNETFEEAPFATDPDEVYVFMTYRGS